MVGVDDGAGGLFAEDLGFGRGVEAGAEVAAVVRAQSVCWRNGVIVMGKGKGDGWLTCRCS